MTNPETVYPPARIEDHRLLTDGGTYLADLPLPEAAHVAFHRSPLAHARIVAVDVEAARRMPGVIDVRTAADIDIAPLAPEPAMLNQRMAQPPLADGVVRFVGEPVACVVAESETQARRAAAAVAVRSEPLPAVVELDQSLAGKAVLHPEAGDNVAFRLTFARPAGRGDTFEDCEVVVRQKMRSQRLAPCPLEVRGGAARWEPDGRLTYWGSTQGPHLWRQALAKALGVAEDLIRVISPDVGGAFGAKGLPYPEDVLLAWLARELGRPLRYAETRTESMTGLGHGRAQDQLVEIGGDRTGRITAYRLNVLQDCGAYPRLGAFLPYATRTMLTGVYRIGRAKFSSASLVTNTVPIVAYRGAGQPEATAALERAVDLFAAEIGMDPAQVRRRNLIGPEDMPFTTLTRVVYDSGDYPALLEAVLAAADYPALRQAQRERRERGDARQLGIGLSCFVKVTNAETRGEFARVEMDRAGVAVSCGTFAHGQGHETTYARLVAQRLGVSADRVRVRQGDSDDTPLGGGTGGSRSTQTGGVAVSRAAQNLLEEAREVAGKLLDAAAVFDAARGVFRRADADAGSGAADEGAPAEVDWADLVAAHGPLVGECTYSAGSGTFPAGAYLAVVEVDVETGRVWLRRMVTVDDAGRILEPVLATAQVHGGVAQGVAQALFEEVRYGQDGVPATTTFADYLPIGAMELPETETTLMGSPTGVNELGVKGIGESGAVGAPPAVLNAVVDAVSHLGVRHIDMPATPERVWHAIREAQGDPDPVTRG